MSCPSPERGELRRAYADATIVRRLQASRALIRRRGLSERMAAELPVVIAGLEAEAAARGLETRGWRPYVDRSGADALLGWSDSGGHHEPRGRPRKSEPEPAATDAGAAMDSLEAALAASLSALDSPSDG
jgi:hypothetical protein